MSDANGRFHPIGDAEPDCYLCAAALTNPYAGETREGCVTCLIREISNLSQEARATFYRGIVNDEEREAFKTAVALEYRRRKKLIAERPMQ